MFIIIMKKAIIGFILGLVVGSIAIYSLTPSQVEQEEKNHNTLSSAANNLKLELNDYIRIQNADEKLRRAEEILGKVMVLFLANVAMQFEPEVVNYFDKPAQVDTNREVPQAVQAPKDKMFGMPTTVKEVIPRSTGNSYMDLNLTLGNLPREFEGKLNLLSTSTIKKPAIYYATATSITSIKTYELVSGTFKGQLYILTGKDKGLVDQVVLESDLQVKDKQLDGTFKVSLTRDGEDYSVNRGNGSNRFMKILDFKKKEILLNVSPSSFFQVYPVGESELFGNYYKNNEHVGVIKLTRD
jgi:hypothetical protein